MFFRSLLDSRWRSLTEEERSEFVSTLKELPITNSQWPQLMLFPDFTHHDSVELTHTLAQLCSEAHWGAPVFSDALGNSRRNRPPGITIYANRDRPDVQTFMRALQKIGLQSRLEHQEQKGTVEVRIGRKNP